MRASSVDQGLRVIVAQGIGASSRGNTSSPSRCGRFAHRRRRCSQRRWQPGQKKVARAFWTMRRMLPSHRDHEEAIDEVRAALSAHHIDAAFDENPRAPAESEHFDLVVTVGGDGTLLAASHDVGPDSALLGVNSSPNHSVGFFCAAKKGTASRMLKHVIVEIDCPATNTDSDSGRSRRPWHRGHFDADMYCIM